MNRRTKRRAAALMDELLSRLSEAEALASYERRPDLLRAIARVRRIRGRIDEDGAVFKDPFGLLRQAMELVLDLLADEQ